MRKLTGSITSALILALFVTLTLPVSAQDKAERVRFAKGQSSAALKGTITGYETKDYLLRANAGQTMTLRLSSPNRYAHFVIFSINDRPTDMNETTEWSERLSETGDYLIRVFMTRAGARRKGARAPYTLTVAIQ